MSSRDDARVLIEHVAHRCGVEAKTIHYIVDLVVGQIAPRMVADATNELNAQLDAQREVIAAQQDANRELYGRANAARDNFTKRHNELLGYIAQLEDQLLLSEPARNLAEKVHSFGIGLDYRIAPALDHYRNSRTTVVD